RRALLLVQLRLAEGEHVRRLRLDRDPDRRRVGLDELGALGPGHLDAVTTGLRHVVALADRLPGDRRGVDRDAVLEQRQIPGPRSRVGEGPVHVRRQLDLVAAYRAAD